MRRAAIALALILVLLSVGWVVQRRRAAGAREDAMRRAEVAWAVLEKCLVGEPLQRGERATVRLRRVAATADRAIGGEPGWPTRCAPHAHALKRAVLAVEGVPRFERLPLYLFELEEDLKEGRLPRDADELWQAAKLARLGKRAAPGDVRPPPTTANPPIDPGLLPLLSEGTAHAVAPVAGAPLRLLFRRPARLCAFAPDGRTVTCRAALSELGGAELVAGDDGARPLLHAVDPERAGLWSPAGERVVQTPVTAAYAFADGSLGLVDWNAQKGYQLHRGRTQIPLMDGEDFRFLGDHLVWRTRHGPETLRLVTARVPARPDDFASMLQLGTLPQGSRVLACRAGETRAVAAAPAAAQSCQVQVALAPDGRWLPSLLTATIEHDFDAWRLDCRQGMATVTWTSRPQGAGRPMVAHQLRCDLTSCGQMQAPLPGVGGGSTPLAADLEGKLLAVWYHDDDSVRMRLGDLTKLGESAELVLLDAERHGGLAVEGLELHTQPGVALLLVASKKGTHAIRIEPTGTFEPVQVVEEP